ncbi:protein required for attachment to host cells [Albidovulum inexpectatum]|uniref:Protein required for attachment to host cells n=1 Tax=Albidovulum inexpectatum TaxID=196587 RepID=A0A2S5JFA5_9RHOB|nr:host attachment protein [Albidovulum inexpectatum]PPB80196.1 protein required for attachment to host cells [Albidovulum inexpectatum]
MVKPIRTLVVLADDGMARFMLNTGIGKGLEELRRISAEAFSDTQIEVEDNRGRQTGGPGDMGRHAFDPHETADEAGRARFADHVVAELEREWRRQKADRLILAAAPKMLGALRTRLKGDLANALYRDLAKDLTKVPPRDLPAHFADIMPM